MGAGRWERGEEKNVAIVALRGNEELILFRYLGNFSTPCLSMRIFSISLEVGLS
jgi:hypothetical protein